METHTISRTEADPQNVQHRNTDPDNPGRADVHDRMPAILRPDDYDLWLDPGIIDPARVANLLTPFDAQLMKKYPVVRFVKSFSVSQVRVLPQKEVS